MGGFAHALGHVLKTGFDMTETGRAYNESQLRQQEAEQRLSDQAAASVQHWQGLGGKLIHDGLVADDGPPGTDGTPTKIYRPPNPERYIAKVKAGKDTLQFEVPNDAEQHAYQIGRQVSDYHQALTNPTAMSDLQQTQEQDARGAELQAAGQARGRASASAEADQASRQRIGIPIPTDIAGALGIDPNNPDSGVPAAAPLTGQAPAPAGPQDLPIARTPADQAAVNPAPQTPGDRRVLLPSEVDAMATAAGKFEDYRSKAQARLNPQKARTVKEVQPSPDGKTETIVYTNGDIEEKPLEAGVKPTQTDTEVSLARDVARGKNPLATPAQKAAAAEAELTLRRLDQSKREARPISTTNNYTVGGTAEAPSTMAQMVGNYKMELSKALPYRTPPAEREKFLQQVRAVNPDFQEQDYPIFQRTEQDAVTGKIGTQANALNTMMGHLGVLQQAALDLKNGDYPALNSIANSFGVATGSTPVTTFNTIVHRIGPEIGKAYVAGGGTAGERGTNEEDFSSNKSPDQILQSIGISASLADSKIKALQKQYQDGTKGRGSIKLLTDEAEGIRQHLLTNVPQNLGGTKGKAVAPPAGSVRVIAPDGTPGFMTKEKLAAAQAAGVKFRLAQ